MADDDGGKPDFLASLKLVGRFVKGSRFNLGVAIILATGSVAFELVPLWVVYRLVDAVIQGLASFEFFVTYAAIAAIATIIASLLLGSAMALSHFVAFDLLYKLRRAIALHMAKLPLGYFANRRSGDAKKLLIDDPEKLELIVAHGIPEGISALVTWFAVTVWLFLIDWRMAIVAVFLTPASFVLMAINMASASVWADRYQKASERMNASIVEFLAGMPVIKVFNRTGQSFAETSDAVHDYVEIETNWATTYLRMGSAYNVLAIASIVLILPVGLWLLAIREIDLSTMLFFVIVGANYGRSLMKLFDQFHSLAQLSISSGLIADVLDAPPQLDVGGRVTLPNYDVRFENVTFSYGANEVLHEIDFTAYTGQVTALVGPSGSGKSTVASLTPRFWDVDDGRVLIGDIDVRDIGLDQLMDSVAFVFQDIFLFSDTIAANIRFGNPDASDEEVEAAAKAARAHDFIAAMPEGYQTKLDEQGATLSGGERQRLAIARAILKDAPIIVLDEATAFADPDNEVTIQEAISELTEGKTLIMIAHRLHTISNADQIIVLDKGRVCESGLHNDLIKQKGLYARMWHDYTQAKSIIFRTRKNKNRKKSKQGATE